MIRRTLLTALIVSAVAAPVAFTQTKEPYPTKPYPEKPAPAKSCEERAADLEARLEKIRYLASQR